MQGQFWTGSGGVTGDFTYGGVHITSIVILAALCIFLSLWGQKVTEQVRRKTIIALSVAALGFEFFWRIIFLTQGAGAADIYPFYPCNLAGILVPIIALTKNKTLKEMFYVFAFIGGIITFAIPEEIFTNQYLNFPILKSILQHYFIIFIPVFEYFTKSYTPKFKNFYLAICGMLVHLANSELVPKLFGQYDTDYIFLRSGLPFVIQGVPGWLTITVFAIIVVIIFYGILNFKGLKSLFTKNK